MKDIIQTKERQNSFSSNSDNHSSSKQYSSFEDSASMILMEQNGMSIDLNSSTISNKANDNIYLAHSSCSDQESDLASQSEKTYRKNRKTSKQIAKIPKQKQQSKQLMKKSKVTKTQSQIKTQKNKKDTQNVDYKVVNTMSRIDSSEASLHLFGGIIISFNNNPSNCSHNNQIQNRLRNSDSKLGEQIQCNKYENYLFNGYFSIYTHYVNKPVESMPTHLQNNNSSLSKKATSYLLQNNLKTQKQIISKINNLSTDLSLPYIISQKQTIQNEIITDYINKNLINQPFYSFHVFSTDFSQEEVNLNKIGYSHKLLSLLNFNYQNCSIQQCQQLFEQFFSIDQLESLQFEYFNSISGEEISQENQAQINQLCINTIDNLIINCPSTIQTISFQYPEHISQHFGKLNERVCFISYNINRSQILNICKKRSQILPCNQIQNEFSKMNNNSMNVSYENVSQNFINKYYSEEHKTIKQILKINQSEELQQITNSNSTSYPSDLQQYLQSQQKKSNPEEYLLQNCTQSSNNLEQLLNDYHHGKVTEVNAQQNLSNFQLNLQKQASKNIQIRNKSFSVNSSASTATCNSVVYSNAQTNQMSEELDRSFSDFQSMKSSYHQSSYLTQQQQQQQQNNEQQTKNTQLQMLMNQFMTSLSSMIQQNQYQENDDEDDDDSSEDNDYDDLDTLLLKIELIKRRDQQRVMMQRNQSVQSIEKQDGDFDRSNFNNQKENCEFSHTNNNQTNQQQSSTNQNQSNLQNNQKEQEQEDDYLNDISYENYFVEQNGEDQHESLYNRQPYSYTQL